VNSREQRTTESSEQKAESGEETAAAFACPLGAVALSVCEFECEFVLGGEQQSVRLEGHTFLHGPRALR